MEERSKRASSPIETQVQLEKDLTETQGLLVAINKLAPGNLHDTYDGVDLNKLSNEMRS